MDGEPRYANAAAGRHRQSIGDGNPTRQTISILWVSGREVPSMGGHDHLAEFYGMFDGYRDLAPIAVGASGTAFQKDLRESYDVLITYDFSRDLDETGRKNLRDFLESGKGLVVLHHALLSYQGWPWWYEEVVGGRYRLAGDGKSPSSTYKL